MPNGAHVDSGSDRIALRAMTCWVVRRRTSLSRPLVVGQFECLQRVDSGQPVSDGRRSKADTHRSASLVEREGSARGRRGRFMVDATRWFGACGYALFDKSLLITAPPTLCVLWYPVIPKCVFWCPDRNPSAPGRSQCNAISSYPAAAGRSRSCRPAPDRGSSAGSPCTRREYGRHNNREGILCVAAIF